MGDRSAFQACGESTTAATSYTGIKMRTLAELPRMDEPTKSGVLGVRACGPVVGGRLSRLQAEIDEKGQPFSYAEVKPVSFWTEFLEPLGVTHIVDFSAGSGALGVAAAGAIRYEGVAANDAHRNWLDVTVDRCVMYKAGHTDGFAAELSDNDEEFIEKAKKYFSGAMTEARRLMMPEEPEQGDANAGDQGEDGYGDDGDGDESSSEPEG